MSADAIRLPGGRTLAYEQHGDPDGRPVLYFHGYPESSATGRLLADAAVDLGARVVAVDRPGHGGSTYQVRRRVRDWPFDVAALAVSLDLEEFAVLGYAAGAPYALACAHDLLDGVAATGIVSPVPPPSVVRESRGRFCRLRYDVVRYFPFAYLPRVRRLARHLSRDPDAIGREYVASTPPQDRAVYARDGVQAIRRAGHREAFRQGVLGPLRDATLQDRGWGFRLEGVTDHVHLWHGREDPFVPAEQAERVAERLPDCTATFYEDDGHVSVAVDHARDILATLVV